MAAAGLADASIAQQLMQAGAAVEQNLSKLSSIAVPLLGGTTSPGLAVCLLRLSKLV